jgi:hypothetical protein
VQYLFNVAWMGFSEGYVEFMYEKIKGFGVHMLMLMSITPVAAEEDLVGTWVAVPDLSVTWTFYNVDNQEPDVWWVRKDGFWVTRIKGEVTSYLEYAARGGRIMARPDESYKWIPLGKYYLDHVYNEQTETYQRKKDCLVVDFGLTLVNFKRIRD